VRHFLPSPLTLSSREFLPEGIPHLYTDEYGQELIGLRAGEQHSLLTIEFNEEAIQYQGADQ